jgi:hypothetical protein
MAAERTGEPSRIVVWLDRRRRPVEADSGAHAPVGDLAPYQGGEETHDDYRHRMIVNLLAFVFCIVLVAAGIWLFTKIAEMRANQDCVLSGRRGCTPVEIPDRSRW